MMRWLMIAVAVLALAGPASATPQFDVTAALQNLRAGRNGDALALLNRAIASGALKGAELADALEWRAYVHTLRRDFSAARADLGAAISAEGANPLRYRARARLLMRVGDYRGALADIETAIAGSPSDAENFTDACEALLALGRRAEALDRCQRAAKLNPEPTRARAMLRRAGGR